MDYPALVTKEDDFVLAEFPDCPGCQTFVRDGEDIQAMAQDALIGWLEVTLDSDETPPQPHRHLPVLGTEVIYISVPLPLSGRLERHWEIEGKL